MLLGRPPRNCTLREGNRTLITLSTWATTGVTQLWRRFAELSHDIPGRHPPISPTGVPPASLPRPAQLRAARLHLSSPTRPITRPPPEPPPSLRLSTVSGYPTPLLLPREAPQHLATQHSRSRSHPWLSQEAADHG